MRGYSDLVLTQKLTTFEVGSRKIDIYVTAKGEFRAEIEDQDFLAPSLDALKEKLRKACRAKSVRVAVPATKLTGSRLGRLTLSNITLTGQNTRTRAILFRYDSDNRADQSSGYNRHDDFYRRLSAAEQAELLGAMDGVKAAERKLEALQHRFELDPVEAIKEAIDAGVAALPEEPTGDPRVDAPARKRR